MQIQSTLTKLTHHSRGAHLSPKLDIPSEDQFQSLINNIPAAVYRCTLNPTAALPLPLRTLTFISEVIEDITHYPASDFINSRVRSLTSIIYPPDRVKVTQSIQQSVNTRQPYAIEYRLVQADGNVVWVYDKGKGIFDENGELLELDGLIIDISDRKQAQDDIATQQQQVEAALRESERHYRYIVETASEGVWMFDADSKATFANNRMAQMLGYSAEEMLGRSLFDFMDQEGKALAKVYVERRRQGIHERHDFKFRRKDGSDLWAIVSATPILDASGQFVGVLRMITDITERKQAEKALQQSETQLKAKNQQLEQALRQLQQTQTQLIHNEKMVSLGQLIAGIAHEMNNPVSFIHGNVTYASEYARDLLNLVKLYSRHYPKPPPEIQATTETLDLEFIQQDFPKLINSMAEGAKRIREIVCSLRHFSHVDQAQMKSVNIHDGIESTLQLLQHRLKGCSAHPQIRVKKEYSSLPLVDCYPGQLNQVFMNLLSNAIDSLTEEAGGRNSATLPTITICTEVKNCNDSRSNTLSQLSDASCVVIRITDNGSGIPQEMQKRIFDPFFSTKPIGKGTGLGLSISQSIVVEKHKGRLTCYSTVGKGTEFVIELPIRREVPNRSQINCGNCQFGNRLLMAQQRLKPSC